jgi:hypothetical protein
MSNKKTNIPNDRMAQYLAKIDFKLLKEQKTRLISIQAKMEKPKPKFTQKDWDVLEGLIGLVDSIQDVAVDEYGYSNNKVFRLTRKD